MEANADTAVSAHPNVTVRPKSPVSVRELVRRRMGVESDPWDLALVQRAEVWDQVRMRRLLDSLLAGYPIGAILLCRVAEGSQRDPRRRWGYAQVIEPERAHGSCSTGSSGSTLCSRCSQTRGGTDAST